jgi:hypothetical protein
MVIKFGLQAWVPPQLTSTAGTGASTFPGFQFNFSMRARGAMDKPVVKARRRISVGDGSALRWSQGQFPVENPGNRGSTMGMMSMSEAERFVEPHGFHEPVQRFQTHGRVAEFDGFFDNSLRQHPAQALPSKFRPDEKAFHFADTAFILSKRSASGGCPAIDGDEKFAFRRRVMPGQTGQLLLEILEAVAKVEKSLVFPEQAADLFKLIRRLCAFDVHLRNPFTDFNRSGKNVKRIFVAHVSVAIQEALSDKSKHAFL